MATRTEATRTDSDATGELTSGAAVSASDAGDPSDAGTIQGRATKLREMLERLGFRLVLTFDGEAKPIGKPALRETFEPFREAWDELRFAIAEQLQAEGVKPCNVSSPSPAPTAREKTGRRQVLTASGIVYESWKGPTWPHGAIGWRWEGDFAWVVIPLESEMKRKDALVSYRKALKRSVKKPLPPEQEVGLAAAEELLGDEARDVMKEIGDGK